MDSNNSNNSNISRQTSTGAIDNFFPTSITTSPHFFDTTFLDTSLPFPTSTTTSSWAQPPPEPTNSLNHPPTTATATATKLSAKVPGGPTGRPSKKRSRASRRAPTTVLTTDTSNFRAMVQEFTGIPAPPFTSSSTSPLHFPRSLNPPPSFLLKPFPHKFQPPFPTSSLTSPLPPPVQHNSFQSLLQSQLVNMPLQQQLAMAASSSSGELRLPDVIGSGGDQTRRQQQQQQQQQQDAAASCKMNFPAGPMSTEFRAEKGSEGREGLMEAWICSSD